MRFNITKDYVTIKIWEEKAKFTHDQANELGAILYRYARGDLKMNAWGTEPVGWHTHPNGIVIQIGSERKLYSKEEAAELGEKLFTRTLKKQMRGTYKPWKVGE